MFKFNDTAKLTLYFNKTSKYPIGIEFIVLDIVNITWITFDNFNAFMLSLTGGVIEIGEINIGINSENKTD
jgi:hypothetical protein